MNNNGIKKAPASRCSAAGDTDADSSAPNHGDTSIQSMRNRC